MSAAIENKPQVRGRGRGRGLLLGKIKPRPCYLKKEDLGIVFFSFISNIFMNSVDLLMYSFLIKNVSF